MIEYMIKCVRLVFACLFSLIALQVEARIVNVPDDFETIQGGIDASEDGDTVLVQPGIYRENINLRGSSIALIGRPENPAMVTINGSENGSVVTYAQGEDTSSVLVGFTIRNGQAESAGGGILVWGSNPSLRDIIVEDNTAPDCGGGIVIRGDSRVKLERALVQSNHSAGGGGIGCLDGSVLIASDVEIHRCGALSGAGISVCDASVELHRVNITWAPFEEDYPSDDGGCI